MSTTLQEIRQLIAATGKYKLEAENTEGANAYAFRAHHVPLNKPVFLKVLAPDPDGELFAEPRLLVEATSDDGKSSNLVRVHDAHRLGDDYVVVAMEYVDGGSVLSRIENGPMPLMGAVRAGIGVLHGVGQLHASLLVHRDIKPANVLLTQRCGRVWPKLTDFGSVARLPDANGAVTASRHSALYVPPEGWATPSRFDVRSDIYQTGLVLFEMVHGPLPYNDVAYLDREARREIRDAGASSLGDLDSFDRCRLVNQALARLSTTKRVTSLGTMQAYVPKRLARVINKATAPNPDDRYQTASEMIGALETLHLPNWQHADDGYLARSWCGWDWRIQTDSKKQDQWLIQRSREGLAKFRRWATAATARAAFRLVLELTA